MSRNDILLLPCGVSFYTNCGVIGIGPDLSPSYGWDGSIEVLDYFDDIEDRKKFLLNAVARKELAELMIDRWKRFGEKTDEEWRHDSSI